MAGSKTGTPTIFKKAREITRLKQKLGASDLAAKTNADFAACIDALITCTLVILASDDFPLQIDTTAPFGPEDLAP